MVRPATSTSRPRSGAGTITTNDQVDAAVAATLASVLNYDAQRIVNVFQTTLAYVNPQAATVGGDEDSEELPNVPLSPVSIPTTSRPLTWGEAVSVRPTTAAAGVGGRQATWKETRQQYARLGQLVMGAILQAAGTPAAAGDPEETAS